MIINPSYFIKRKSYRLKTFPVNGAFLATLSIPGYPGAYTAWGMTHDLAVENVLYLASIKLPNYGV